MPHLSALYRFPLKSAMAETLQRSSVDGLGLLGDRRWMLVDEASGRFLTQRALGQMSQLAARCDGGTSLTLSAPGYPPLLVTTPDEHAALRGISVWKDTLQVPDAGEAAAQWLSRFIGKPTRLVYVPAARARHLQSGYGQDGDRVAFADGFPLLLIGQGSLDDLSSRVGRPLEMLRFRPNLVVDGIAPYTEDQWQRIRIGTVEFRVVKPCSRCILTTIDPATGERASDREPLATLKQYRAHEGDVFFGQNLVADGSGELQLGMPVTVLE